MEEFPWECGRTEEGPAWIWGGVPQEWSSEPAKKNCLSKPSMDNVQTVQRPEWIGFERMGMGPNPRQGSGGWGVVGIMCHRLWNARTFLSILEIPNIYPVFSRVGFQKPGTLFTLGWSWYWALGCWCLGRGFERGFSHLKTSINVNLSFVVTAYTHHM